jgi:hypothetical protein
VRWLRLLIVSFRQYMLHRLTQALFVYKILVPSLKRLGPGVCSGVVDRGTVETTSLPSPLFTPFIFIPQ